jgi:nucleoside recognition membrane protein YjiH
MDAVSLKNILKFILGTLLGLFLVVVPLSFGKSVDTFSFYYLKKFVSWAGHPLEILMTGIIVLSAVMAFIDLVSKPKWIEERPFMKALFSCSRFETGARILGAVFAVCACFMLGPKFITSIDTGGTMLPLATQLSILIPPMILFQTFILEFGFMEFLGTVIGFIMKPLFKVTEMASVSIISAWLGPVSAGAMAAKQFFDEGYFTVKEAATIGACFAISSIGWCSLVANVLGIMDYFSYFYLTIVIVGVILAMVSVRIPPLSLYPETYKEGVEKKEYHSTEESRIRRATVLACERAEEAGIKNFTDKIPSMLSYIVSLQPIVVCYGMIALILCTYTPILVWASYPLGWFMSITGVPEAYTAAPAVLSGFADNYLPVILGKGIASPQTKFIVGAMSIVELIYMSEIGALLLSTKLIRNIGHVVLIFVERTVIALPLVVLMASFIF